MQLFRDLDVLSFVRISRLNWIGHVNGMDSKRKVSQVFNNNRQGSRLIGRLQANFWNCVQTDINKCKIKNWKEWLKNTAAWKKSTKETKVRIGLSFHQRYVSRPSRRPKHTSVSMAQYR